MLREPFMSASLHADLTTSGLPRAGWLLWLAALALVPVTSLALIPIATPIRPPTPVLAALAMLFLFAGRFIDWRNFLAIPQVRVLGMFASWAILSGIIGLLLNDHPPSRGYTGTSALLKSVVSLGMGAVIYLAAQVALTDTTLRKRSEFWLVGGMTIGVLVAILQALAATGAGWARDVSLWIAGTITVQYGAEQYLNEGRTWGLSLEPSFMASVLGVGLLPIACSRALVNGSRLGWLGTALGCIGVGLSTSRGGILYVVVIIAAAVVWSLTPWAAKIPRRRRIFGAITLICFGAVAIAIGDRSSLISNVVRSAVAPAQPAQQSHPPAASGASVERPSWVDVLEKHGLQYRALCGVAAWHTFKDHPVLGTGFGLSSWSLTSHYPEWARNDSGTPEARDDLDPNGPPRLANAKNMPLRILAELGVIGLALWLWFIWLHRPVWDSHRPAASLLPMLALATVVVDWLTLDSFALAGPWLALAWAAHAREQPATLDTSTRAT